MCQTLTDKPVYRLVNTHEHFDHLGANSYFDKVYMTQACKDSVTAVPQRKFELFKDVDFPVDYDIEVVEDGYIFDLGGRQLEVFCLPDHAAGSLMLLDRKNKLLFSGDELGTPAYKEVRTSVAAYARNVARLYENIEDIDWIFGGGFVYDRMILFRQDQCLKKILAGHKGLPYKSFEPIMPDPDPEGRFVIPRRVPNPYDIAKRYTPEDGKRYFLTYGYCTIIYDPEHIYE